MSIDSVARGLAVQALALITGKSSGGISSSANPAITLTTAAYNLNGQIQLNNFGSIKIGAAANLSGAPIIVAAVQQTTGNFHSYDDTSTWAPTVPSLGCASFSSGKIITGAVLSDHVNGFQAVDSCNAAGGLSTYRGLDVVPTFTNGTVAAYAGVEVQDPSLVTGGAVTNSYAFQYLGSGEGSYNWGFYQYAASGSNGPWNYMNGALGLGVAVPNVAGSAMCIAPTRSIGWSLGNGQPYTAAISQPVTGLIAASVPFVSTATVKYNTDSSTSASTLLTAADISGGTQEVTLGLTGAITSASNAQLPLVTGLVTAIGAVETGQSYKLIIRNDGGSGSGVWTITTNTGWGSLLGTMTIAVGYKRSLYVTFTSTTTATLQSVGIDPAGAI